jgi:hypothetical protein
MWNGNAVPAGRFLLAALILLAGCDSGTAPRQEAAYEPPLPTARYRIDPERGRVWLLARDAVFVYDLARPERVTVPLPGWVTLDAAWSCPPDLALGPSGEAVVTSNTLPTLWRIDPDTLAVTVHPLALDADRDKDVGFSGLAYSAQQGAFIAASYAHGSLWSIDPRLERAQKIPVSAPLREACGLAVQSRSLQPVLSRLSDVCVSTPRGGYSVVLTPHSRSAQVYAAPCAGPSPFDIARFDHPGGGEPVARAVERQ